MAARGHEGAGAFSVGLFDEGLNRLSAWLASVGQLDVPVPGLRTGWRDAEGHHRAALAGRLGGADRSGKAGSVLDPVIGGQHQQLGALGLGNGQMGGQCDGRRGVAALRLQGDALPRQIKGAKLLGHQEAVRLVADHNRRLAGDLRRPQHGVLQQGTLAEQGMERLGEQRPRQRP